MTEVRQAEKMGMQTGCIGPPVEKRRQIYLNSLQTQREIGAGSFKTRSVSL